MPRLFSVLVGCNYWWDAGLPLLRGAENDAWSLVTLLHDHPPTNGEPGSATLLLGPAATTAAITEALSAAVARQGPEDMLLFYFAGHGLVDPAEGVLLKTADGEYSRDQILPILTGAQYPPNPTAILLDCCHADAFRGRLPAAPVPEGTAAPIPIPNIHALYATGAADPAFEEQGRGRFTAALLTVLAANPALLQLPFDISAWLPAISALMTEASPATADRGNAVLIGQPFQEEHDRQQAATGA